MNTLKIQNGLENDRLLLRKFEDVDAENVLDLFSKNRERLKESRVITTDVYEMQTLNDALNYIKKMNAGWIFKNIFAFGMFNKENNELIGEYKIFNVDWKSMQVEIGGFLDYKSEGKLYFIEVFKLIKIFVFEQLKMNSLIVKCQKTNVVSVFSITHTKGLKKINEIEDMLVYSMSKENYFTSK